MILNCPRGWCRGNNDNGFITRKSILNLYQNQTIQCIGNEQPQISAFCNCLAVKMIITGIFFNANGLLSC